MKGENMARIIASKRDERVVVEMNGKFYLYWFEFRYPNVIRTPILIDENTLHEKLSTGGLQSHEPPDEIADEIELHSVAKRFRPATPEEWRKTLNNYRAHTDAAAISSH